MSLEPGDFSRDERGNENCSPPSMPAMIGLSAKKQKGTIGKSATLLSSIAV